MSFYMLGGELARTVGPLLVLGGISVWGLEGTYKLIPLGLFASLLLFFQIRKIKIKNDFDKNREKPHHTLKKLVPFFTFIGIYTLFLAIMKSTLTLFLPAYIKSINGSLWMGGIALSILQFSGAIGTMLSGHLSDKLGRGNILKVISFGMPITMLLFTYSSGILMVPVLLMLGLFAFASNPVILAFIQDTDSDNPAFLNSIYMTMSFFISSLIAMVIGFLADRFGLAQTFRWCAFVGFGMVPISLLIPIKNE